MLPLWGNQVDGFSKVVCRRYFERTREEQRNNSQVFCPELLPILDPILQFETSSRNAAESVRYGPTTGHRVVKDRLMRQEALVSFEEATSWSLLWYLHGKGSEELPEELILFPTTSYLEACQFVDYDHAVPFKHCPSLGS